MAHRPERDADDHHVTVDTGQVQLDGDLSIPAGSTGIVAFAHGSGSSRFSSRNRYVAQELQNAGLATLLFDLLTPEEDEIDSRTRELRFDIPMLSERVVGSVDWLRSNPATQHLRIGLFGASTGAAAALVAAAERPDDASAIVSRGGRPDLAGNALPRVQAPALLIVGGRDEPVIGMNRDAMAQMRNHAELEIIDGATHLFEEPGALEQVASLARDWFLRCLA